MISNLKKTIESKLINAFQPKYLEVENESHMHNVPKDSETHFKVTLVSEAFEAVPLVRRHQSVYSELGQELKSGVHALALHLYTSKEWAEKGESAPGSPQCLGGGKK